MMAENDFQEGKRKKYWIFRDIFLAIQMVLFVYLDTVNHHCDLTIAKP